MYPEEAPYHIWITRDPENTPPINKPSHEEMVPRAVYDDQQLMLREISASRKVWIDGCNSRDEIIKRHEAIYAGLLELQEITCAQSDEFAAKVVYLDKIYGVLKKEFDILLAENDQLTEDMQEEWKGTLAIMEKFGGRSDETITMFVTRLVSDRDFWAKTAKDYKDDYNEVIRRGPKDE